MKRKSTYRFQKRIARHHIESVLAGGLASVNPVFMGPFLRVPMPKSTMVGRICQGLMPFLTTSRSMAGCQWGDPYTVLPLRCSSRYSSTQKYKERTSDAEVYARSGCGVYSRDRRQHKPRDERETPCECFELCRRYTHRHGIL